MKKKIIVCISMGLCLLLSGCITSKSTVSKEKLKEEVAKTSPGEVNISPDVSEDSNQGVKLLQKRKPYNIFSKLFRKERPSLSEKTPEIISVPEEKETEILEEEPPLKEDEPVVIAKKETTTQKSATPQKKEVKEKGKEKTPSTSQYISTLEPWNGECLVYQVSWNSIDIGKGLLACEEMNNNYGDVYHILGLTIPERSIMGAGLNLFRMDAYLDKKTLQPYYYYQYNKGSDEKEDILEVRFDWKNRRYYTKYRKYNKGQLYSTKEKTLFLPDGAYDSISIFYIIRTLDLENHSTFTIPIAMKEMWDLTIQTLGKKTVNIPGKGKGEVYVLKPQAQSSEGFFTKGAMDLWLTTDAKRVPVYLEGRVTLGKARLSLLGERKLAPNDAFTTETITNILAGFK
ncbi:MAG: DUF3108 domain-containing protein [Candidatus Ratteibacteria bacterium]|nr:DUF3108 domain-containing protein [Candidatus Ratteibacteria bacterium]